MISKTEGISINYIKYKDTSIIARVFTRDYGLQSLIINGIRSKNSRKNPGYFEPFSVLELVLYFSKDKDLHRLSEFRPKHMLSNIRTDMKKSAITLFLSEVLAKVLQAEKHENIALFEYLEASVVAFDHAVENDENFHLQFLIKLTTFLGFGFEPSLIQDHVVTGHASQIDEFAESLATEDFFVPISASGKMRSETLDMILKYYQYHLGHALEIRSLEVLKSVFR